MSLTADDFFVPKYQDESYVCGDWSDIFLNMTSTISTDAAIINQLTNYLSSGASAAISDVIRSSGIQQLETQMKSLQNDVSSLKQLFTAEINTSGDIFDTSLNVVSRAEAIVDTLDRLDNYANDILNSIDTGIDFISSLPENIEKTFDNFQSTLEKLIDFDLTATIDKLPSLITDKLLDLDIIKDPLILLTTVQTTVVSITSTIASIKAPQNLNDVRAFLTTLRGIIAQIQAIKAQVDRITSSIERLADTLKSGNFISLVASLAAGGVSFFERPSAYNAIYPFNHGYKTHGGHVFERDNTPGSERVSYTHPSKTSVEVQPDGGVVVKGKSDFQLSVSKNCDVYVKNAATITVDGDVRIIANNVSAEAKGNATVASSGNVTVTAIANANVSATGSAIVTAGGTCSVSSVGGTSISSNGLLTLSSNTGINMISEGPITINSTALSENTLGPVVRTNVSSLEITSGIHQITGAPISLN